MALIDELQAAFQAAETPSDDLAGDLPPVPELPVGTEILRRSGEAPQRRGGRPKLWPTAEMTAKAVEAVESGGAPWVAALACGISEGTWKRWWRARHDDTDHGRACAAFFEELEVAHATASQKASRAVFLADPKTWLTKGPGREKSRQRGPGGWGEGWGDSSSVEITGADGGPLQTANLDLVIDAAQAAKLTREERDAWRAMIAKIRAGEASDGSHDESSD